MGNITNKGLLKLFSTQTNSDIRLYTQSNDATLLKSISSIACKEFGFNRSVNAVAMPVSSVNPQNVNGLNCAGNERSIKECHASPNANANTLFEVEVECLCNFILFLFLFF